jgi:putative membrane protein
MAEKIEEKKRILILCVDRDGDLGVKTEIKTPLIGREANLNAAIALALKDPEESDANAMFEAVRLYDRLIAEAKSEEVFEIAAISGSELGGVSADRKIVAELSEVLKTFPASEVILVTDGYSDEAVLPLIESRVPVSSVRRVVVRHSESIEETAALFTRYLKTVLENPRYARMAVGLPGLLLLILGILSILGLVHYYLMTLVIILGICMLVKGFSVDRLVKRVYTWMKEYSPPPLTVQVSTFSVIVAFLCVGVGIYLGSVAVMDLGLDFSNWVSVLPQVAGHFIKNSKDLIVIGVCLALTGRAIRWYFERDARLLLNSALIVLIGWGRQILEATSEILINPKTGYEMLIFTTIVGILIGVASILVILVVYRSARDFFKRKVGHEELEEG